MSVSRDRPPQDHRHRRFPPDRLLERHRKQGPVLPHRLELVGVGQEAVEKVARSPVGGLYAGRQQEAEEGVDLLVVEAPPVHFGRQQVADQVVGRMPTPLLQHVGEVVAECGRSGDAAVPVGGDAGDGDGPSLEGGEVLSGQPEDLGDDLDGKVERQLLDQVGGTRGGEPVDELVHHPLDQVTLPPLEHLGSEGGRHQCPVQPVLGLVHLEDGPPHHRAHDPLVHRRRVRLVVPQDLHRLFEAEHGDRLGFRRIDRFSTLTEVDGTDMDRALGPQLGHHRIGVADVPRDRVLELERIEWKRCLEPDGVFLGTDGHRSSPLTLRAERPSAILRQTFVWVNHRPAHRLGTGRQGPQWSCVPRP